MIREIYKQILKYSNILRTGTLLAFLLLGVESVSGQCPKVDASSSSIGLDLPMGIQCAKDPLSVYTLTAKYRMNYTGCIPNNPEFRVNWGDGTTQSVPPSGVANVGNIYDYSLILTHRYPLQETECSFNITVDLYENGVLKAGGLSIFAKMYHQTDDYSGAKSLQFVDAEIGKTEFLVCEGQEVRIRFKDITELNCNYGGDFEQNDDPRYLQFEYGTGISNIPSVFVSGSQITNAVGGVIATRIDGGNGSGPGTVYKTPTPTPQVTNRLTNEIYIPHGATVGHVGKEFRITLYNWNKCNELQNKLSPTAADRGYAIKTEALIRVVAQPPKPDDVSNTYCNRKSNNYQNAHYSIKLTHNPGAMRPGYYEWYRDDGSGGPNLPGHPDLNSPLFRTQSTDPSGTTFNPVTKFPTVSQDYLDPAIAQKKYYWVVYFYENPAAGTNPYPKLCGSEPARIEYVIREDISAIPKVPTGKLKGCPDEIIRFTLNNTEPTNMPIGGDIMYVWEAGSNCTIVATEPTHGKWVDVELTAEPAAPADAKAKVSLSRRWKNPVNTPPNCGSAANCPFCPSIVREIEITVNPRPTAVITGGGEICAGETLPLTISNIKGAPASTTFNIVLTNGETILNHLGVNNATIQANPADGTVTVYKITSLKDNQTGCINTNLTTNTTVTKRNALTLTGPVTGPDPVCENTNNQYSLDNDPDPAASQTVGGPTRYQWAYNGSTNSTTVNNKWVNSGAATNATTPATRNIEVYWEYTTQAGKSALPNRFCPSPTISKAITIQPKPVGKVVTPNRTVCQNTATTIDIELTGTPNVAWEVTWTIAGFASVTMPIPGTATGSIIFPMPIPASYQATAGTRTFTLNSVSQQTGGACAGSVGTPATAQIKTVTNPTATISGSTTVCEGTPVDINLLLTGETSPGRYLVTYTVGALGPFTIPFTVPLVPPVQLNIPVAQINQANLAVTTVTVTNVVQETTALDGSTISCSNATTSTYTIINQTYPVASNAGPDWGACVVPGTQTLAANAVTAPDFGVWSIVSGPACGGTFSSTTANNATFTANCNGRFELRWTVTGGAAGVCPPSTDEVVLDWGKAPNKANAGPDASYCYDPANPPAVDLAATPPDLTIESGRWIADPINPPGAIITNPTQPNSPITVTTHGIYKFKWELYNACDSNSDEVEITFVQTPKVNPIPDQYWCPEMVSNMPAFASSVPGASFKWAFVGSPMPGFPASNSGQFPNAPTPPNNTANSVSYKIRVTVENTTGTLTCRSYQDINIYLKPRPVLETIAPTSVCAGTIIPVEFKINPSLNQSVTYNWNNSNPNIGLPANGPVTAGAAPFTHQFTPLTNDPNNPISGAITNLTATVDGCVSLPKNVTITVNPIPVFAFTSPDICPEDIVAPAQTAITSTVTGMAYNWTYTGAHIGLASPTGTTEHLGGFTAVNNTGNTPVGGNVTITGTANGCSLTGTFPLVVKPRPIITPMPPQSVCPLPAGVAAGAATATFGPINFQSNFATDITYQWKFPSFPLPVPAPASGIGNIANITIGDNTSGSNKVYTLEVIALGDAGSPAAGCSSKPETIKLTVNQRPRTSGIAPDNQVICSGDIFADITFHDNAGGSSTYDWTIASANVAALGASASGNGRPISFGPSSNTTNAVITGTITINATSPEGCVGPPATTTLTVNPIPVLNKPNDLLKCSNEAVPQTNFTVANGVVPVYSWDIDDNTVGVGLPSSGNLFLPAFTTFENNTAINKSATVKVTADVGGCTDEQSFRIIVKPNPRPNSINDIAVCPGVPVNIPNFTNSVTGNDASVITWNLNNGNIGNPAIATSGAGNIAGFTSANNTTGADIVGVYLYWAEVNNCKGPDSTFTVTVTTTPDIAPQPDLFFCNGVTTPYLSFTSTTPGAVFNWSQAGDNIGLANPSGTGGIPSFTTQNNTAQMLSPGVSTISVFTEANKCRSVPMSFDITVRPVAQMNYTDPEFCANVPTTPPAFDIFPPLGPGDVASYDWVVTFGQFPESDLAASGNGNLPLITPNITIPPLPATNPLWGELSQTVTVTVAPTLNGCIGTPGDVKIIYNPIPVTEIILPTTNCVAAGTKLVYAADGGTGTAGSVYNWTITNSTPAANGPTQAAAANHVVLTYPGKTWAGDLNVVETSVKGCVGVMETKPITVIPAPVVDAGPDQEICEGQEAILNGRIISSSGGPYIIDWFPGTSVTANATTLTPTVRPFVTTTISLTVEEGGCRSNPDQVTITVRAKPNLPVLGLAAHCASDATYMVTAGNITAGNDINWGRMITGVFNPIVATHNLAAVDMKDPLHTGAILPEVNALPSPIPYAGINREAIITYGVYQTVNHGTITCASDKAYANMALREVPAGPVPVTPIEYCKEGTSLYNVSVLPNVFYTYRWYDVIGGQVQVYNNDTYAINAATIPSAGTYTYYATQAGPNGCESDPVAVSMEILPNPVLGISVTDAPVGGNVLTAGCADFNIFAHNTSTNGAGVPTTYHWEWDDGKPNAVSLEGSPGVAHLYENTSPFEASVTLKLVGETTRKPHGSAVGCRSVQTQTLRVFPKLKADFRYGFDYEGACTPAVANFQSISVGANSFKWDFADGTPIQSTTNAYINHTLNNTPHVANVFADQYTYNVTLTAEATHPGGFVCTDAITHPVVVNPTPKVDFEIYELDKVTPVTWTCSPNDIWLDNKEWSAGPPPVNGVNTPGTTYQWTDITTDPNPGTDMAFLIDNRIAIAIHQKITLNAENEYGCIAVPLTKTIEVLPFINAVFIPTPNEGCAPHRSRLENHSEGGQRFKWYWDLPAAPTPADIANYTGKEPTHQFPNTTGAIKVYNVWLYAENGSGAKICSSITSALVTVHPQPKALFTHDAPAGGICAPLPITFTRQTAGNPATTSYVMDFDDGNVIDPMVTPTLVHSYHVTMPGTFNPTITATATSGSFVCTDTYSDLITVKPQVIADFTGPIDGCSPFLGQFVSQSSGASNFSWTFTGAGSVTPHTSLNVHTPMVTLTNAGHTTVEHVTVRLDVSNNYGCTDHTSGTFLLNPQPAVSFVMDKIMGCPPLDVTFTNTSNGNPAVGMTYTFEFGDVSSEVTTTPGSVLHTYSNLSSQNAQVEPTLTAKNQWNCSNEIPGLITIYPYIVADFRMSDSIACPPLSVNFTNGSKGFTSLDWRVNGSTWASWVQGGGSAAGLNPSYTFTNSNMLNDDHYQVELVASNGQCTDTRTRQVLIYRKPIPDFTASPMVQYYPGSTVAVTNKISNNATVVNSFQYNWQLSEQGSGISNTFSTLPNPGAETIGKWGIFDIIQAVYAEHCSDQKTLTVSIIPPVPLSGFDSIPPACMPYEVQFNNTSKNANTYFWDFGDGFTSNVEHPIHLYPDAGTYTVTLTIKGDGGTTSSKRKVVVHPMPRASFEVKPDFLWVGQDLRAFPYTSNTTSSGQEYDIWYRWDWGDNSAIDTARQPLHMYRKAGKYDVTLTIGTYTSPQCIHSFTLENAIELQNAGDIILPNSFKPWETGQTDGAINNEGYQNNLFYPPVLSPTRKYSFVVYNRWGQLLFETTDPGIGWDGYFKGKLCDEGVYIYKIEGVFETGQSFSKMGDILLLR